MKKISLAQERIMEGKLKKKNKGRKKRNEYKLNMPYINYSMKRTNKRPKHIVGVNPINQLNQLVLKSWECLRESRG